MSAADDYLGIGFCGIDSKQRFTLPVEFRHRVRAGSGDSTLLLHLADERPFLLGFGKDHLDEIKAEIVADGRAARERGEAFDRHGRATFDVADVETVNFDDGGRFSLSDDIREMMGITDCLFFVGAIWTFEVWSPARFLASGEGSALRKTRCRNLMQQWADNPKNPNRTSQ